MIEFFHFDRRGYETLRVAEGYSAWARSYDETVPDRMDWHLMAQLKTVDWQNRGEALDFACGTGRTGAWLKTRNVRNVDGIDLTEAMLERARTRGIYRHLLRGDVRDVKLPDAQYDLVIQSLADEHLPDLHPLYREARRLSRENGKFVLIGYHPDFLMAGIPTHFDMAPGHSVAIENYVHLFSDHFAAAQEAGWVLDDMIEGRVDDEWIAIKPKWAVHRHRPINFALVWR